MTVRITKFGVEVLGKALPAVEVDPAAFVAYPLISQGNWRGSFSVTTIWQTSISRSQATGSEEREGRVSRPTRVLRTLISGMSRIESGRMLANAFSMTGAKYPAAIYSDYTLTTNSHNQQINCNTKWRRFFPGQRVAILPEDYDLDSTTLLQAQFGIIDTMTTTSITLVDPLAAACNIGDVVLPLIDAQISLSQEMETITDAVIEWEQESIELSGSSTLPGLSDEDVHYLEMDYYLGYPVMDFGPDWGNSVKVGMARDGSIEASGNTDIVIPDGASAYLTFAGSFWDYSRRTSWRFARFFDSRKGRLRPFWAAHPVVLFEVTEFIDLSTFRASAPTSSVHLSAWVTHVIVLYVNETVSYHAVSSMTDEAGAVIEITLSTEMEALGVISVTSLHLCRFDQDTLVQEWATDEACSFQMSYRSLLDEAEYVTT